MLTKSDSRVFSVESLLCTSDNTLYIFFRRIYAISYKLTPSYEVLLA